VRDNRAQFFQKHKWNRLLKRFVIFLVVIEIFTHLFLVVDSVIEEDAAHAEEEGGRRRGGAHLWGEGDLVERVEGVEGGHPHQTAPAQVVAGAVVGDVQRVEVTSLPPEELGQVDSLQGGRRRSAGYSGPTLHGDYKICNH